MILDLRQLQEITRGVVRIEEQDGWFRFCRMTAGQEDAYLERPVFREKARASANVRLAFRTSSEKLSFRFRNLSGSSRPFGKLDLYRNGALVRRMGFDGDEVTEGVMEIPLGEGEKNIELYFPWGRRFDVSEVTLEGEEAPTPLRRRYRLITFGDSITQGYDADRPSFSYVSRLARMLDADEINKGVGGDKFNPRLLDDPDVEIPDLITVAYGTNDWSKLTAEEFSVKCGEFYKRLSELYPTALIFAVSPIWRIDGEKVNQFGGNVWSVEGKIRECVAGLPNVIPVSGTTLVPHLKDYYRDLRVHPNDSGFACFAEGLHGAIVRELEKRG